MHPNEVRAPIERTHGTLIDARRKTYADAKVALEQAYLKDLRDLENDKRDALAAAGLNRDGSVPLTFDTDLPFNTVAPAVTGTPTTGQTLTCTPGSWLHKDSVTYQWQRDGVNISGATAATRVLAVADQTHSVRCVVTAHNESGTTSANSNAVAATA